MVAERGWRNHATPTMTLPVTMPSNLIIAAVTAFRNAVNSIQGTEDPGQQLRQTATSLGEVANVLDQLAASTAAHEQQFSQMDQRYMRVYLWFAGTTGLALTEKTRMLMHPTPPKHEHEIADALEKVVRTGTHSQGTWEEL